MTHSLVAQLQYVEQVVSRHKLSFCKYFCATYRVIILVMLAVSIASAQGGSVSLQVIQPGPPTGTGGPAPFATVRVCPSTGSGTPCSPLSSLFQDPGLTIPASNPATTDQYGNASLWVSPGPVIVQVTPVNGILYSYLQEAVAGTVTSVGLTMPSIFNVSSSPVTSSGTINVTLASESANLVFASPNGTTGLPSFRSIVASDFGTQSSNTVLGNCTGSTATPTFCSLTAAMIPSTLNATNFSGNVAITGNLTASGTLGITGTSTLSTVYCKQTNNIRCVDAINSAGWAGSDAFGWINAAAANLPTGGGTVDARGLGGNSFNVSTVLAVPLQTTLLLDPNTVFNMNHSGGSSQDAITYADASTINCGSSNVPFSQPYGGFKTTATTNVRSLLAPAIRSQTGGFFGQSGTIIGCNFIGNSSSATISSAMVDIQGCSSYVSLQNINIWNPYNTIGLQISAGTSSGNGCSDLYLNTVQVNGENVTGARPCVINGQPNHAVGGVSFFGLICQHAGNGQYELEINGHNSGASGFNAPGINIFGGHIETATGSLGLKIADAGPLTVSGMNFSGPYTSGPITISETLAGNTAGIHLTDLFGGGGTNWVTNSAAGGVNVTFNACGSQPCAMLGDYSFKRFNAPQVASASGCTTAASIGGQCATATTVTWPVPFTDTNYIPSCQGAGAITNFPIIGQVATQSASAITVQTTALTAAAASFASIKCTAVHQ